ncbi:MAG: T9SS type A sorting domain-containing protein, partial [Crocinitomicaceae bacterium]
TIQNYTGNSISTIGYQRGIYFVKVKSGMTFATQKLIVR